MSNNEHGSSRRTVLKGAAWAAPAIVVATAAPAMAASGPALVVTTINAVRPSSNTTVNVTVSFSNSNTGGTGNTYTDVTVSQPTGNTSATPTNVMGTNWSFESVQGTPTNQLKVWRFRNTEGIPGVATATSPPGVTSSFSFAFSTNNSSVAGTVSAATTPTSGTVAPPLPDAYGAVGV
ncbi:hypothetical protein [Nocardioides litoris]|uniref:hypothetical protein n=1 Tax=Nocardioides litoris TaxID=1926648 RepID=UPI00111E4FC2|nr:hypothetical protein [Nocardioides litoris]